MAALLLTGLLAPFAGAQEADPRTAPAPATVSTRLAGLSALATGSGNVDETADAAVSGRTTGFTSAPVRTPIPFSLVGFDAAGDAPVAFRTSTDGRDWSAWQSAAVRSDDAPDPGSAEARAAAVAAPPQPEDTKTTEPVWVGEASWLQTRTQVTPPEELGVHLVDSAGLGRTMLQRAGAAIAHAWRGTGARAAADAAEPDVITRQEWGADESLRDRDASYSRRARFGVLHHTVGRSDYDSHEGPAIVRGIYAYHVNVNGWSDIGYNLLVDRFGNTYEGRAGGVERAVLGAHAGGFNTDSFGVALMGNYDHALPPDDAMEAVAEVFAWKFDLHHIDVAGAHEATSRGSSRFSEGTEVRLATLSGHRDVSSTACPGGALYAAMPVLRDRVLRLHGDALVDHEASPRTIRVVDGVALDGPIELSTRLRPAGEWTLEVTAPTGLVVHRDAGEGAVASSTWTPLPVLERGTYVYEFAGAGRRSASDELELEAPVIAPVVSPAAARVTAAGTLAEPARFTAELWPEADWHVELTAPEGEVVLSESGRGDALSVEWNATDVLAGVYGWRITADDAEPVAGDLPVAVNVLDRVGDEAGAVASAVEVSRSAFPDAASADRAVLARADVFADAMTGGPLAGDAGPVLLTPGDALADEVDAELARVLPAGDTVYVLGGEAAIADAVIDDLDDRWRVQRLAGTGRIETAAEVADAVIDRTGEDRALIARAGPDHAAPWADAIAGGAWGAHSGVPVLLTDTAQLSPGTARALERLDIAETIVLGGEAAVSAAVLGALPAPRRVRGDDRAGTATAIAAELWGRTEARDGDQVVLTPGYHDQAWTLALAAAPLAARNNAPLLLANGEVLPPATRTYLEGLGYGAGRAGAGWVLGDPLLVPDVVADEVSSLLQ